MKIVVYGPGCPNCRRTEKVVRTVAERLQLAAEIESVTDYAAMAAAGVMQTPAVSIDGVLKLSGRVPREEDVEGWLAGRGPQA